MSVPKFERPARAQRRVVVTGLGIISPIGNDLATNWSNVTEGVSGIATITHFDPTGYDTRFAGEIKGFEAGTYVEKKEQKKMDRFIHLCMGATAQAIADSGITITEELGPRAGALIGVGLGGLPGIEAQHKILMERGPRRVTPFFIPMVIANLASGQVSIKYGLKGPNYATTSACASGVNAIGDAAQYIRNGWCDVMVAGGSESVVSQMAIAGFSSMHALSSRNDEPARASRPFDRDRDGFVLSEAAATLILEDYEHALKRGAKIYGEISGYGVSSDAYHMTSPAPGGAGGAQAMAMALKDAALNPSQIQHINAHATSTPVGDGLETQAIKSVFGDHAKKIWISATKSMTGHALGAAGAIESVYSLMALKENIAPPTINLENPSDDCDLDYVPQSAREGRFEHVVNNSFGFGGTNASLIFSKV